MDLKAEELVTIQEGRVRYRRCSGLGWGLAGLGCILTSKSHQGAGGVIQVCCFLGNLGQAECGLCLSIKQSPPGLGTKVIRPNTICNQVYRGRSTNVIQ